MGDPIINTQVDAINATLGNIKVDLAALRPSIRAIKDAIAETYITDTIENVPIASFSDGADEIPVRELQVAINPIQNLNGQTSPWPAGGGKNLLSSEWQSGSYGANGNKINDDTKIRTASAVNVSANTTYTLSFVVARSSGGLVCYYTDDAFISRSGIAAVNPTFTTPANCTRVTFAVSVESDGTTPKAQLEQGSSATAYAPYSNICPITGWSAANVSRTGVNIWDEETEVISTNLFSKNFIKVEPSTDYYISTAGYNIQVSWYDEFKNAISNITKRDTTITSPNNAHYMKFFTASSYGTTYNHNISINYPATDTEYHAYTGTTYPLSFGQTVYGGTLNVTTGVLTVDRQLFTLDGTETWVLSGNSKRAQTTIYQNQIKHNTSNNTLVDGDISNLYQQVTGTNTYNGVLGFSIAIDGTIHVSDGSGAMNIADFKTALSTQNLNLILMLATPTTVQLTAAEVETLFGQNSVWCSSGNVVKLTYRKAWEIALAEGE